MNKNFEELKLIVSRYDGLELDRIDVEILKGVIEYINDLKDQLKQRDEVIDELESNILGDIDGFESINEFGSCNDILEVLYVYREILRKYKGDSK